MSKQIKKSDLNKGWVKPRRDRKIPPDPEYHLIVTEGIKTEPNYFEGLKQEINLKFPNKIMIVIEGQGDNTLSLLKRAEKLVFDDPNPIKHVWLVYDKDSFPPADFDNTAVRCGDISDNGVEYHALWSNECIELWFLLHFEYLQSALCRNDYYPKLSKHLKFKYEKNNEDIYKLLRQSMQTAIRNAKKLEELHNGFPPSKCSPGTNAYKIFEFFINGKYLKTENV
jgi:hypothetical protein